MGCGNWFSERIKYQYLHGDLNEVVWQHKVGKL